MKDIQPHPIRKGKPKWLRKKLPTGPEFEKIKKLLKNSSLNTVCQEAQCPNQFECYSKGTATFMILGDKCTRNCTFCAVGHQPTSPPDHEEPVRVAEAVKVMQLKYAVVTSVTRDDVADGGASVFAETVQHIRQISPQTLVEILIPDLQGDWHSLKQIVAAEPDVLNHNIETVKRLYSTVRPQAIYQRSLDLLAKVKEMMPRMVTKSGLMVGLGETREELVDLMQDLLKSNCDILTIGQYLQPSRKHLAIERFVPPDEFDELRNIALDLGFLGVAAGPSVRSSYEAEILYRQVARNLKKSIKS